MTKRIILLFIIFSLLLPASALAAETDNGIIEGTIVNGTDGGSSVAGVEITLKIYLNDNEVSSTTTIADAEGNFVFDGLSTEQDYSYEATLNYQEADYASDWISFDSGETSKSTEVIVYDSTTSDEVLTVMTSHTIVYIEPESLRITEYYLFVNESDKTYIGLEKPSAPEIKETLRFNLPEDATALQPEFGLMECCIYGNADGFIDSMPVLPGGREVAYSYMVDNNSGTYTFSKNINYNIKSYDFLVQGGGITVNSDRLTAGEPIDIEGILFTHLSGTDFLPGDTLVAELSGLPETGNQGVLLWVFLVLAVLGGAFGLNRFFRGRRPQPVKVKDSHEQKKQRLLVEIAQMDDDFENGKISEEVYRKLRTEKKAQLIALM